METGNFTVYATQNRKIFRLCHVNHKYSGFHSTLRNTFPENSISKMEILSQNNGNPNARTMGMFLVWF